MKSSESEMGTNDDVNGVSRRKLAKSQWLTEVKDNTNRLTDENYKFKDERTRRREKELKEWQTNALNTISSFDLSSSMAQRLFSTLFCPLNQLDKYLKTINYEEFCDDSYGEYTLNSTSSSSFVTRISRTRDGNDWSSRKYHHKYCFNRFERLEKWRQLETGLNWRSRLLKSRCRQLLVPLNRIKWCPICIKTISLEPRHQCYEFEPHMRTSTSAMPSMSGLSSNSSLTSNKCDSSDEVIVIGDDFLEEDLIPVNEFHDIQSSLEVIKPDVDEDDDEVMIVEEVFKTKELNVIVKPILTSLPKTSSSEDCLGNGSSNQTFSHKTNQINCKTVAEECHTISLVRNNSKTNPNSSQQKGFDFASNLLK